MNRFKKTAVGAGLAAGLLTGGVAGLALGTPGISGAQEATTTTVAPSDTPPADGAARAAADLQSALAPLVEAGTIDQAQADAVASALAEADVFGGHGPGHGGHGDHGQGLDAAATALGMTEDELREATRDGQTLSEIATAEGVDAQVVIDAMVADLKASLDERVADGDLTQAEADEKLADSTERITDLVTNGRPSRD